VRPFLRFENDRIVIRAYTPDGSLPSLRRRSEPYTWEAPKDDEALLRSRLIEADWPAPPPSNGAVWGPPSYRSRTPYSYQLETRKFGKKLLLADDPGLGKTLEALMFIADRGIAAIIVCRASAKQQWVEEAQNIGLSPVVWEGKGRTPMSELVPFRERYPLILHYEQLRSLTPLLVDTWRRQTPKAGVVLDECHAIKNPEAGRTGKVFDLFFQLPYKVLISATPIRNRTAELWPQLAFLDPERFRNWPEFALRYCDGKYVEHGLMGGVHLEAKGTSNWDELVLRMKPFLLRRTYDEVKIQLPPITRVTIPVEMTSKDFEDAERTFQNDMRDWSIELKAWGRQALNRKEILAAIQQYRMAGAIEKAPLVAEWLQWRPKTLVVTSFAQVAEAIAKQVPESLLLTGNVPPARRPALLDEFHRSEVPLIATLETGGESLNLQSAYEVGFIDLPWTPAAVKQAEQRVWRQGQKEPVVVTYFVGSGTMEEKVVRMLLSKENRNPWGGDYAPILTDILELQQEAR
jgi:SWI/SNF-related matrix-associated actin-dependent regulator of chromatin subfamily A-like protein 1